MISEAGDRAAAQYRRGEAAGHDDAVHAAQVRVPATQGTGSAPARRQFPPQRVDAVEGAGKVMTPMWVT